jgi:phospholipid N-methyltransferase
MNLDFLKQLILSPREIGSLVPSSRYLAQEMVRLAQINATENTTFIEVGPGTGVITKLLCESIRGNQRVLVLEKNINFYKKLVLKFSSTEVIHGCVSDLSEFLKKYDLKNDVVIVSSLPWISFSAEDRNACLSAIRLVLERFSNSSMLQYTYSNKPPVYIDQTRAFKLSTVYLNFPPARIWKYAHEV